MGRVDYNEDSLDAEAKVRYEKNCNLLALPYPSQREEGLAKGVACETSLSTLVSQPRLSRGKRDSGQFPSGFGIAYSAARHLMK